jgi:two-component sensor histidine kinase
MKTDPISIVNLDECGDKLELASLADEHGAVILERNGQPQYVIVKWEGGVKDISNAEEIIRAAKRRIRRNLKVVQGITKRQAHKLKDVFL